jgi:hypothetical protein
MNKERDMAKRAKVKRMKGEAAAPKQRWRSGWCVANAKGIAGSVDTKAFVFADAVSAEAYRRLCVKTGVDGKPARGYRVVAAKVILLETPPTRKVVRRGK